MQRLSDGSILAQQSPAFVNGALIRYQDLDNDGIADIQETLYTQTGGGPLLQLVTAGDHFIQGNLTGQALSILKAGATPGDPIVEVGALQLTYPTDWTHTNAGLAVRPTAQPGVYDLVFNVGSQFDNAVAADSVVINGLGLTNETLIGDSLYMVTLDLTGGTPVASNVRQVAEGIRNVFGMQFDSAGNLWFTDNAINGVPFPVQAEELNRISAADLGNVVHDFGFPTCFPDYFTGIHAVPGCTEPVVSFLPKNGEYSQGATQLVFAPEGLPAPYNNGIFITFVGEDGRTPVIYYDFATGEYVHFIKGGSLNTPTGLLAANGSLFISDFGTGEIFQISPVPEPASYGLTALGLGLAAYLRRRRRSAKE